MSRPPPGGSAGASGVNRPSSAPLSHTGASKGTGTRMLCEPTGRAPPSFHSPEAVLSVNADPGENLTTPWGGGIHELLEQLVWGCRFTPGQDQSPILQPECPLSPLWGLPFFFLFFCFHMLSFSNTVPLEYMRAQSCPTLCNPLDCSRPGSSVHGISQARILEWVDISSSKGLLFNASELVSDLM